MSDRNLPTAPEAETESTSERLLRILLASRSFIGNFPDAEQVEEILNTNANLQLMHDKQDALWFVMADLLVKQLETRAKICAMDMKINEIRQQNLGTHYGIEVLRRAVKEIFDDNAEDPASQPAYYDISTVFDPDNRPPPPPRAAVMGLDLTASSRTVDEGGTVNLALTMRGSAYDEAEVSWSVLSGGGTVEKADGNDFKAVYTAPQVGSNTPVTVEATVKVSGAGTRAEVGTEDSASQSVLITVVNVLPDARAPVVTVPDGVVLREDKDSAIAVSPAGGVYDRLEYEWSAAAGSISGTGANVVFTPPDVSRNTDVAVSVKLTAKGTGSAAADGTTHEATYTGTYTVTPYDAPDAKAPVFSVFTRVQAGISERYPLPIESRAEGGAYDTIRYEWSVASGGGTVVPDPVDPSRATYTSDDIDSPIRAQVLCRIEVTGTGRKARAGTSATAAGSVSFQVNPR